MSFEWNVGLSSVRLIEEKDLRMILEWRNSDHVRSVMLNDSIICWDEHKRWYDRIKQYNPKRFLIYMYDNKPVGFIGNSGYDEIQKTTDAGYYLGERGLPLNAVFGVAFFAVDYAFEILRVKRIDGIIKKSNKGPVNIAKRMGYRFNEEKKPEKNTHFLEGYYYASLVEEDWNLKKERIKKIL